MHRYIRTSTPKTGSSLACILEHFPTTRITLKFVYVYMCVCVYVCMLCTMYAFHGSMYACIRLCTLTHTHTYIYLCIYTRTLPDYQDHVEHMRT